jgi:hypothetical protein
MAAALAAGCVAVNAGKPDVFRHTETRRETAAQPARRQLAGARGRLEQRGDVAVAGILAEYRDEYPKTIWEETVTVRLQKRLAVGLFPGAAEQYLMPLGALKSGVGLSRAANRSSPGFCAYYRETDWDYVGTQLFSLLFSCGICQLAGTVNSLLVQPFAGWSCDHDWVDGKSFKKGAWLSGEGPFADASQSPKIKALAEFTPTERRKMGIKVCWDSANVAENAGGLGPNNPSFIAHLGLAGFHKHLAVFVEPAQEGPRRDDGVETRTRRVDVPGPYWAELSIPALGHTQTKRVERGSTRAEFALPEAARECVADAVVTFRPDSAGGAADEGTRRVLERVAGQSFRFDVTLRQGQAPGRPAAAVPPLEFRQTTPAQRAPVAPPRTSREASSLWEITGIRRTEAGYYEVRVAIADRSKTFDIGWAVEADVRRIIRENFANRHPGTGIQYVHEVVEWETEENGAVLVYRGWAFSARPMSDGWAYDDESRRGTVRLRISDGMPPEEAKRWARQNIEAIVKEKNVALEAGGTPPAGAMYRSLGEALADGVLTVEFEALE